MDSLGNLLHSRSSDFFPPQLPNAPVSASAPEVTAPTPAPAPEPQQPDRLTQLHTLVREIEDRLARVREILADDQTRDVQSHSPAVLPSVTAHARPPAMSPAHEAPKSTLELTVHEGVFNGEEMIGADGQNYPVPTNYASKSKLVEGDLLKVTILPTGELMYKQTGPVERDRKMGKLVKHDDGSFTVVTDNVEYRVLTAAVTYHRGAHGHTAIVLVPRDSFSTWAAVECIFHQP